MLVEDDTALRDAVASALSASGYEVHAAANGLELERITAEFRPDAAILDVRLDEGPDGFALASELRRGPDMPLLFVTAATLRGVHQIGGLPWNASLWSSMQAQTSLTIVWSVLGVVGWVAGSRRGSRALWVAGAVLMGVVLVKLLLVDRTHLGSVLGIVSFIAYGLLCTVIGYLAPAPPRQARAAG